VKWNRVCSGDTHAQDKAVPRRAVGGARRWPVQRCSVLRACHHLVTGSMVGSTGPVTGPGR
jgi:hypothetical protein